MNVMSEFHRILLPVDLKPHSVGAVTLATDLAAQFDSELILLHVLDPRPRRLHGFIRNVKQSKHDIVSRAQQRAVRQEAMQIVQRVRHRNHFAVGIPEKEIVNYARAVSADLIVMPTRCSGWWDRLCNHSVTASVMRAAPCSVWTGQHELLDAAESRIRHILCAIGLGPNSGHVLRSASSLAKRLGAALTTMHADPRFDEAAGSFLDTDWSAVRKSWAMQDFAVVQAELGTAAGILLKSGEPASAIAAAARELSADLLVIGKSTKRRIVRNLLSNAYGIVCNAPCPVMSV